MSLEPFKHSEALTFGVELELQLVNRHDYDLAPFAPDLIRALKGAKHAGRSEEHTSELQSH